MMDLVVFVLVTICCLVSLEPVSCLLLGDTFNDKVVGRRFKPQSRPSLTVAKMGLYDNPLPPRPVPSPPDDTGDKDDLDLPTTTTSSQRLFSFRANGTEERSLLPQLSRALTSGIECYYEVTDRKVQNLISKTNCHPEDAAWALEACQGDMTEAWTRISTARRILLNQGDTRSPTEKAQSAELAREELEAFKAKLKVQKRRRDEYFSGGKADTPWIPRPNPRPIDDEPWFTG